MRKDDVIRLRHMLDAAQEACAFAVGRAREDLNSDRQLTLALVKAIEIIGEAASRVSMETRQAYLNLPQPGEFDVPESALAWGDDWVTPEAQ